MPGDGTTGRLDRRWLVGAVAVVVLLVAVVVGLRSTGQVLRPLPDPDPAPGLLDREGLGPVRLGQTWSQCRRAGGADGPCGGGSSSLTARDDDTDCARYDGPVRDGVRQWVWARDGVVVVVGMTAESPLVSHRTWPGLLLVATVDPPPPELDGWATTERDATVEYRLDAGGVTTVLVDAARDGRLDTALVADGDALSACDPARPVTDVRPVGPQSRGTSTASSHAVAATTPAVSSMSSDSP
jgi:hypothetical protein